MNKQPTKLLILSWGITFLLATIVVALQFTYGASSLEFTTIFRGRVADAILMLWFPVGAMLVVSILTTIKGITKGLSRK